VAFPAAKPSGANKTSANIVNTFLIHRIKKYSKPPPRVQAKAREKW
jgi:hypothetical protein